MGRNWNLHIKHSCFCHVFFGGGDEYLRGQGVVCCLQEWNVARFQNLLRRLGLVGEAMGYILLSC